MHNFLVIAPRKGDLRLSRASRSFLNVTNTLQSVDIEHSVEVVDLVLEDDCSEATDCVATDRNRIGCMV